MADALERVIRPIVEGQIMSYLHDHPEIAEAYAGKRHDGRPKAVALKNSLAKRIVRDLLCAENRVRLEAAVVELSLGRAA